MRFRFSWTYFWWTTAILGIETYIAWGTHDAIIRPYGGDFLVVILLYCLVRSCTRWAVAPVALSVLVFSYIVETLQYFHFADRYPPSAQFADARQD